MWSVATEGLAGCFELAAPFAHRDVLLGRPVLLATLHCCCVLESGRERMDPGDCREPNGHAEADCGEGIEERAHRRQQRKCTADEWQ